MKASKFFLSTLVAAAAMTSSAYAVTVNGITWTDDADAETRTFTGTATGYVCINGTGNNQGLKDIPNGYSVVFSSVGGNGNAAWFTKATMSQNIQLLGTGLIVKGGTTSGSAIFSGSVSGEESASFTINSDTAGNQQTYLFTGDITQYKGSFSRATATTGNLEFGNGGAYSSNATEGVISNISGSGSILTSGALIYNYATSNSNSNSYTTLSVDNSSITAANLQFTGGATYSVASDITGFNATASNNTLTVSAGSVTFNGAVSNFGNLNVAAGATATFGGFVAGVTSITVGDEGILTLSGTSTFTDAVTVSGALTLNGDVSLSSAIQNSGTVSVEESVVFDLTNLTATDGGVYTLIENGTITEGSDSSFGWTKLGYANFTKDGNALGRCTVTTSELGKVSVSDAETPLTLVWSADAEGTWDNNNSTSWVEQGTENSEKFYTGDSVVFNSDATVTVSGKVAPAAMSVNAATTLAVEENETATVEVAPGSLTFGESGSLVLNSGVSLDLSSSATAGAAYAKIEGEGTVKLALTQTWGNTVSIGSENSFSGTVTIASGWFTINKSDIGTGAYNLESGAHFQVTANATVDNDIVFNGTHEFHTNGSNTLTLSGKVTGSDGSSVTKKAGGTVKFSGGVDLATFTASAGRTEFSGTGTNTIGTLNVSGGTTTISGTGTNTIGTLSHRGGSTVFESDVTITGDGFRFDSSGSVSGSSTINEGVTVNATTFHNSWGFNTLTVNGTLNVTGDMNLISGTENKVVGSGTINVNHLIAGNAGTYTFSGVTLNIGTGGITGNTRPLTFGKMTIGVRDDASSWTATRGFAIGSTEGTTFQTDKDKSISVSGVVSGEGMLIKSGAGELTLSGTNTYEGGTMISEGTLIAGSASALGDGAVGISGGTLEVSSGVALDATTITISLTEANVQNYVWGMGVAIIGDETGTLAQDTAIVIDADEAALQLITSNGFSIAYANTSLLGESVDVSLSADFRQLLDDKNLDVEWQSYSGLNAFVVVPEPSAFGLLAGVGALALVAARRRRRS